MMNFDFLGTVFRKIPKKYKICFLSGTVVGWLTHFYMLTHKLPNWDDINQVDSLGLTTQIGRWMLEPLRYFGGRASNPAVHGALFIAFISLAACFVLAALELESTTSAVLIPAVMVTFPSTVSIMTFMFTAHMYAMGICLFCMSAYLLKKYKWGFIPAGVCIVLGLAIYQPFVSVAISLMLLVLIRMGIEGTKFGKLVKNGCIYAFTLGISTYIYIIIAHIIFPDMGNMEYGGVDTMGQLVLSEIPRNFGRVYKRVLEYFVISPYAYITPSMKLLNITICLLVFVLAVICVIKNKMWKRGLELAFVCLMTFLLPFAMGFVYFMAPEAPFSTIMIYAYSMLTVFLVLLTEIDFKDVVIDKTRSINCGYLAGILSSAICSIAVICICYSGYLIDSQAYFRMSISYERVYAYYNRILSQVESTEGYANGDNVVLLGEFYYKDNPSPVEIPIFNSEGLRELSGVALENGLITSGVRKNFIETYVGFDMGNVSNDTGMMLAETPEYKKMPIYPAKGSIAKINDVWVVKLCE